MCPQITNYDICFGATINDLNVSVRSAIQKGWQPFGSPIVTAASIFYQPVVQYAPPIVPQQIQILPMLQPQLVPSPVSPNVYPGISPYTISFVGNNSPTPVNPANSVPEIK